MVFRFPTTSSNRVLRNDSLRSGVISNFSLRARKRLYGVHDASMYSPFKLRAIKFAFL